MDLHQQGIYGTLELFRPAFSDTIHSWQVAVSESGTCTADYE